MSGLRIAAIVLIVLGLVALASPVITYTTRDEVLDVGPIEVTQEETKAVPFVPIMGVAAIAIGVGLLVTKRKITT